MDIIKRDVGDVDLRWVSRALRRINVEVALVQHDGMVRIFDVDVLVRDVVDPPVSDVLSCPCLETGAVLAC